MKPTWCTIFSQCFSSVLFITTTCFGPLQVHHQEKQLYLYDTRYLLFCIAECGMQDGISFQDGCIKLVAGWNEIPSCNQLDAQFFSVFFVNFIYNLYMFRTSPGPSSVGTSVFTRHLVLILSGMQDGMKFHPAYHSLLYRITSTQCRINTLVPPDDGPGEFRNM